MKTFLLSILIILVVVALFRTGIGFDEQLSFRQLITELSEHPFPIDEIKSLPGEFAVIQSWFEDCNSAFGSNYDAVNQLFNAEDTGFWGWLANLIPNISNAILQVVSNIALVVFCLFYVIGAVVRFFMLVMRDLIYWIAIFGYVLFGTPFPTI